MRSNHAPETLLSIFALLVALSGCGADGDGLVPVDDGSSPTPALDGDSDGYREVDGDCDDTDGSVHPGAVEGSMDSNGNLIGDGVDNNCDGRVDDGTLQFDGDQDGWSPAQGDCNDEDGVVHPGLIDGCDGVDNDCDTIIDEDAVDSYEPNDTKDKAIDTGDQTCNAAAPYLAEFNIYPDGDRDFFRFRVREGGSTGCDFHVQVDLAGGVEDVDLFMNLYKESGSALVLVDSVVNTGSTGDFSVRYTGSTSDDTANYYVEIGAAGATPQYLCTDEVRVLIYGFEP